MAAHGSSEHAEQAGQPGIGEVLEQRMWPREQTDLYFLLGCVNALMGVAATRLGYLDAAGELHRAGWAYASAIGHRPLMARLRCELACIACRAGRFGHGRDLALSGLGYLAGGPGGAHLHASVAQAAARLGQVGVARRAVHDAHEAFERDYSDDLLETGGEWAISRATHWCMTGAALTLTADAGRDAAAELEQAASLYDAGPAGSEQHWFAGRPLAGIALAIVRLRSGALDSAAVALEPALSLPPAQRISDVTTRLTEVRAELGAALYHRSPQAQDLAGQIGEYAREAAAAGLHALAGSPG